MNVFSTIYKQFINKNLKNISAEYMLLKLEYVYRRKPIATVQGKKQNRLNNLRNENKNFEL